MSCRLQKPKHKPTSMSVTCVSDFWLSEMIHQKQHSKLHICLFVCDRVDSKYNQLEPRRESPVQPMLARLETVVAGIENINFQ